MKVSVEWLREYVDLPECADELVDVLPMLGIEVEEDEESGDEEVRLDACLRIVLPRV